MSKIKHTLSIIMAVSLLLGVLIVLDEADKKTKRESEATEKNLKTHPQSTSVIEVFPANTYAKIVAFGEVKPHWKTTLRARTSGEVLTISSKLQEGKRVEKGEVLFTFDHRRYQTQRAEVRYQITQAELLLQDEKQQAKLARMDWKLAQRKGNPSGFALRVPQIKAAQAQLNLANTRLAEITQTGRYAKITAPYDGIVLSRAINLGDVVEAGQELAEIMSSDKLDIKLKLDDTQWQLLGINGQGKTAKISSIQSDEQWIANVDRRGGFIDATTRQHLLHLTISSPHKPLTGSFVRVDITGKKLPGLLKVPASALAPDGYIWFVNKQNKLKRFLANVVFSNPPFIFVTPPKLNQQGRSLTSKQVVPFSIVVYPLSSFLPEIEVVPSPLSENQLKASQPRHTGE